MAEYTKIGRIRPVFRGEWDSAAGYTVLDIVRTADGAAAYIAVQDAPAGTALTDGAFWQALVDVSGVISKVTANAAAIAAKANAPEKTATGESFVRIWPEKGGIVKISTDAEKLLHAGRNICPGVIMGAAYMSRDGSFNTNQPSYTSTKKFPVVYSAPYVDSTDNDTPANRKTFHYWDADGNWLGVIKGSDGYTINDRIEGAVEMAITYYHPQQDQIAKWAQVETGTAATAYEPFRFCEEIPVAGGYAEIPAAEGENTIFGETTNITADYNKSLERALDEAMERIAALEAALTNA